jgi:hypothetical protein
MNSFQRVLRGAAKDDWEIVIAPLQLRTQATFLISLAPWKTEMILPTAWQTLVDYLEQ